MTDTSKASVAYALTRTQGPAAAFAAPALAADGVDINANVPGTPANRSWKDGTASQTLLRRGPRRGLLLLSSDGATSVTNGQIYYYVASLARWYSIGLIYSTGAATLTATAGAMVEFALPAAADRLAFGGTLSAGNVTANFVPVWEEA
jgi:hypothetical protein